MSPDKKSPPEPDDDTDTDARPRDLNAGRRFSLADAIGGQAGGELLQGASPVTRRQQAELEIDHFLENHLVDAEGALQIVLLRGVADSALLLEMNFAEPLVALDRFCEQLLASATRLRDFVTAVDAEWGRLYDERPRFEVGDGPAAPDDPYTLASVRDTLLRLREELRDGPSRT